MATSNSERFLSAFNLIEQHMQKMLKVNDFVGFASLVHKLTPRSAVIREYADDLKMYAKLRNAIVHEKLAPGYVIAEPHLKEVEKIEKIERALSNHKTLGEQFRKPVRSFQVDEPFTQVLGTIYKHHYSQFPVYEGKVFMGLLTVRGISNWLAMEAQKPHVEIAGASVRDVLFHEKNNNKFGFIRADLTMYDAVEVFKKQVDKGSQYYALLITENGKKDEKLIGIVTPIDVVPD